MASSATPCGCGRASWEFAWRWARSVATSATCAAARCTPGCDWRGLRRHWRDSGGRIFSSLLFHVGVLNALPWILAIAVLMAVVLLATYLPARRAASIEPMEALRTE